MGAGTYIYNNSSTEMFVVIFCDFCNEEVCGFNVSGSLHKRKLFISIAIYKSRHW